MRSSQASDPVEESPSDDLRMAGSIRCEEVRRAGFKESGKVAEEVPVNLETKSPESILSAELGSGERLLWSGRPRGGLRLRPQDVVLIPFSLLWGGFVIFWEVMALSTIAKAPAPFRFLFPLFGLPFVAIGLYLIVGRFFADARARARTIYGVTNQRILIVGGSRSQQTRSLELSAIPELALVQHKDGTGTITFGGAFNPALMTMFGGAQLPVTTVVSDSSQTPAPTLPTGSSQAPRAFFVLGRSQVQVAGSTSATWSQRRRIAPLAFEFVERPREVEDVIRSAQRSMAAAA